MNADRTSEIVQEVLSRHEGREGALLVTLQDVLDRLGFIPPEVLPSIEQALGVPQGEATAVISFYRELRTAPPTRHHVRVCDGDSCAALGSRHLAQVLEDRVGNPPGGGVADSNLSHDKVYCLGNCALSPSISIDGEVYGRVTPESLLRRLEELDRD